MVRIGLFRAVLVAMIMSLACGCDAGGFVGPRHNDIAISPATVSLSPGEEFQFSAVVRDENGQEVQGITVNWSSSDSEKVPVNSEGRVTALAAGVAMITAVAVSGFADTAEVTVRDWEVTGPPPSADVSEFILGPQVAVGAHPWPQFDEAQIGSAEHWANAYLNGESGGDDYYDLALVLYQIHARTGDMSYLDLAHQVALKGWTDMPGNTSWTATPNAFAESPRMTPFAGLTMLALSGVETPTLTFTNPNDPSWSETYTLWEWLTGYARKHYLDWIGRHLDSNDPYYGIRDGGMLLRYVAILAKTHPDADVQAEMLQNALDGGQWYARIQRSMGAWLWNAEGHEDATQPFQHGLLLDGLIAVHQLTGDPGVGQAIVLGAEAMGRDMIDRNDVPHGLLPGKKILAAYYIVYGPNCQPPIPIDAGCGNDFDPTWDSYVATNKLRVKRHRSTMMVHGFGYAYRITGEQHFRDWGDELFEATYGDPDVPVLNNKGKEYNQAFRSSGRYLAWRIVQ